MKTIILAGGKSERMKPISDKPLLKICGKELIRHQIDLLSEAGFDDFVVVCSPDNNGEMKKVCDNAYDKKIKIEYAIQELPIGSAGAILSADRFIGEEPILLVCANDVLQKEAYRMLFEKMPQKSGDSFILSKKVDRYFPGGYVLSDEKGFLKRLVEKPGEGNEPSDLMNIYVHAHGNGKELIKELKQLKKPNGDHYFFALHKMIDNGYKVKVLTFNGIWQPIKYPWHVFHEAMILFSNLKTESNNAPVSENAHEGVMIFGEVIIEKGVKIGKRSIIEGPSYIGENTVIEENCVIKNSFIGENTNILKNSIIEYSFLGVKNSINGAIIKHSIIGNESVFEEGFVTECSTSDESTIKVMIKNESVDSGTTKLGIICGDKKTLKAQEKSLPGYKTE